MYTKGYEMRGIYKITNLNDGKVYIGKSEDLKRRIKTHKLLLKRNKHFNYHLQNAYNKYGEKFFQFDVIHEANDDEDLNILETHYIKQYNAFNQDYGYNMTTGGEGNIRSEETRNKISINHRGKLSNLTVDDVRHIKMSMYCLMDRKEISKMFNVSQKVLTQISSGKNFPYVCPELNDKIHNLKQRMIDERNEKILELYNNGMRICDIANKYHYTTSVVEKVVYTSKKHNAKYNAKVTKDIKESVIKDYVNHTSIKDITIKYDLSDTTIRYIIKRCI